MSYGTRSCEGPSFTTIGIIIFLCCVVIAQFATNYDLHKQLHTMPKERVVYVPITNPATIDEVDDIEITECTLLPEDFYDEIITPPVPSTVLCERSTTTL